MTKGRLLGIAIRQKSRAPMMEQGTIEINGEAGCAGDSRGKPGDRQVTVMAREDWEAACGELARELPWTTRRANLLVEGLPLRETTGLQLTIGNVVLEITGETDPCGRMDELAPGLCGALQPNWRGGVCCRVLQAGVVSVGDQVEIGVYS